MQDFDEKEKELYKPFEVVSICRQDLESEGYYAANISDPVMIKLATKIHEAIIETFWAAMHSFCQLHNIKTRESIIEEAETILYSKLSAKEIEYEDNGVFYLKDQYQDEFNSICDKLEETYLSKEI